MAPFTLGPEIVGSYGALASFIGLVTGVVMTTDTTRSALAAPHPSRLPSPLGRSDLAR
jgi:hypothetical protein